MAVSRRITAAFQHLLGTALIPCGLKRLRANITAALALALLLPLLAGCADGQAPPEEARLDMFAMDTAISLLAYGDGAEQALLEVEQMLYAFDRRFSLSVADSEINRINAAGGASRVSAELRAQLTLAAEISERSGGAFDLTICPLMRLWGFGLRPQVPDAANIAAALPLVDYSGLSLDNDKLTLSRGQALDLGAIAKGYASQAAADRLRELGISSALLNLGGNVQLLGERPEGGDWRVAIRDPLNPDGGQYVGSISAHDAAVVTSGGYQRYFEFEGRRYHHILTPHTGYPAENGLLSATIVADDGMLADALSTALFVMGRDAASDYWRQYGGFEFVLVGDDLEVWVSAGLQDKFAITENDNEYIYSLLE